MVRGLLESGKATDEELTEVVPPAYELLGPRVLERLLTLVEAGRRTEWECPSRQVGKGLDDEADPFGFRFDLAGAIWFRELAPPVADVAPFDVTQTVARKAADFPPFEGNRSTPGEPCPASPGPSCSSVWVLPYVREKVRSLPGDLSMRLFDRAALVLRAARGQRSPLGFFLLVFALSVPFWIAGAATEWWLLPGLPVSSLMLVCPAVAAVTLTYGAHGTGGASSLLKRAFDYARIGTKAWYAPILLLMPGVTVLTYGLMRLAGSPLPHPEFPLLALPAMLLAFFIAALGEELGWSGYATDPMQDRWGAFRAGLLLGLIWAAWHIVPLAQAHRSVGYVAWWSLFTVAARVLVVWIYNSTGKSVFAAALFHATINLGWQLFPNHGSHWDPRFGAPIVLFAAAIVTLVWGSRALARYGDGPRHE